MCEVADGLLGAPALLKITNGIDFICLQTGAVWLPDHLDGNGFARCRYHQGLDRAIAKRMTGLPTCDEQIAEHLLAEHVVACPSGDFGDPLIDIDDLTVLGDDDSLGGRVGKFV
jgi:hypothetical protein